MIFTERLPFVCCPTLSTRHLQCISTIRFHTTKSSSKTERHLTVTHLTVTFPGDMSKSVLGKLNQSGF